MDGLRLYVLSSPMPRRSPHWTYLSSIPGLVLDLDATLVLCHSEKEHAAKTWKKTFGYHPLLCFLDTTGNARHRYWRRPGHQSRGRRSLMASVRRRC